METLFGGPLAAVMDVRCRMRASPCGGEERTDAHYLVFTRAGAFVKHSGSGWRREVVAEPLRVLCLNRGEPYRVSHPADGGDECTVLAFAADSAFDVAADFDPWVADVPGCPLRISHAPASADVLLRMRALRRALRGRGVPGPADPLAVEAEALAVLGAVLRDGYAAHGARTGRRATTWRDRRDLAERTREVIATRPADPLSLSALAREVHSSPYHLTRTFREVVGMPVHRYRLRLRLALALERLDAGGCSVSELALALGFSSHSHFTATFRRAFGVAPTAVVTRRVRGTPWRAASPTAAV